MGLSGYWGMARRSRCIIFYLGLHPQLKHLHLQKTPNSRLVQQHLSVWNTYHASRIEAGRQSTATIAQADRERSCAYVIYLQIRSYAGGVTPVPCRMAEHTYWDIAFEENSPKEMMGTTSVTDARPATNTYSGSRFTRANSVVKMVPWALNNLKRQISVAGNHTCKPCTAELVVASQYRCPSA